VLIRQKYSFYFELDVVDYQVNGFSILKDILGLFMFCFPQTKKDKKAHFCCTCFFVFLCILFETHSKNIILTKGGFMCIARIRKDIQTKKIQIRIQETKKPVRIARKKRIRQEAKKKKNLERTTARKSTSILK